jgi:hypothetical protein
MALRSGFTEADERLVIEVLNDIASGILPDSDFPSSEDEVETIDLTGDDSGTESDEEDDELSLSYQHHLSSANLREAEAGLRTSQALLLSAQEMHRTTGGRLVQYHHRSFNMLNAVIENNESEVSSSLNELQLNNLSELIRDIEAPTPPPGPVSPPISQNPTERWGKFDQEAAMKERLEGHTPEPITFELLMDNLNKIEAEAITSRPIKQFPFSSPFKITPKRCLRLDFDHLEVTPPKISNLALSIKDQEEIASCYNTEVANDLLVPSNMGPDMRSDDEYYQEHEEELWRVVTSWDIADVEVIEEEILNEYTP